MALFGDAVPHAVAELAEEDQTHDDAGNGNRPEWVESSSSPANMPNYGTCHTSLERAAPPK